MVRRLLLVVLTATACAHPTPPPIDNVHRAPLTTMVAVPTRDGLLLATVTPREVRPIRTLPSGNHFGWLDEHTLIVASDEVVRYVDGQRSQAIPVSTAWAWAGLIFTGAGEVWLERCGGPAVPTQAGCDDLRYLQVTLDGAHEQRQPPLLITMPRDGTDPDLPWPRPAPVPPPAGLRASLDTGGQHVACTTAQRTTTYPSDAWDLAAQSGYAFTSVRWMQTDPPILELALDVTTPIGTIFHTLDYVRACAPRPLDGYVKLGAGVWAAYAAAHNDQGDADITRDGTWSFYAHETLIGTLVGGAGIRANHPLR